MSDGRKARARRGARTPFRHRVVWREDEREGAVRLVGARVWVRARVRARARVRVRVRARVRVRVRARARVRVKARA